MDNRTIATWLSDYANFLEATEPNLYRVRAYRRGAETVLGLDQPVSQMLDEQGRKGLEKLPGIGSHLAFTIDTLVRTGEFRTLDAGLSGRLRRQRLPEPILGEPAVADLLAIDQDYRNQAEEEKQLSQGPWTSGAGPEHSRPPLYAKRQGWDYQAVYSTIALAHRLGQTRDWVVIYFDDGLFSGQRSVVTETRGNLRGRRVVRGREAECRDFYENGEVPCFSAREPCWK